MPLSHAQGGPSVAGHAGEALAQRKTELQHLVKADFALFARKLGPPEDGTSCRTREKFKNSRSNLCCFNLKLVLRVDRSGNV